MSSTAESAMARLWRDRVQRREQERNEAQTRACVAVAAQRLTKRGREAIRPPWEHRG